MNFTFESGKFKIFEKEESKLKIYERFEEKLNNFCNIFNL